MILIFHLLFYFAVAVFVLLLFIGLALHVFNTTDFIPSEDVSEREGV